MKTMIAITSDALGHGDEELGGRLVVKFLHQLCSSPDKPELLAFYNAGVRLLSDSSPALGPLRALAGDGVELIACGTCVDHFHLREALAVGRISDMREIVSSMLASERVITV